MFTNKGFVNSSFSDEFKNKVINEKYYDGKISNLYTNNNNLVLSRGDNIDDRYEILKIIGRGAFSKVYKCKNHMNNKFVALKIIKNDSRYHNFANKEYKLYEKLLKNEEKSEHFINCNRFFTFNKDLIFDFDLHGKSLYSFYLDISNPINIKDFSKQILLGLSYLHNNNIIHCDLKPENILIKDNILKIIDIGSSVEEKEDLMINYIQSRWYRAPEVLYESIVTRKIDVWSYGCIIYELYYRKPLFKGKTEKQMKYLINNFYVKYQEDTFNLFPQDNELNNFLKNCLNCETMFRYNSNELLKSNYFN